MAADGMGQCGCAGYFLGGVYALFAAGLSLMFGVMRFISIAHGDFIVMAAYALMTLS